MTDNGGGWPNDCLRIDKFSRSWGLPGPTWGASENARRSRRGGHAASDKHNYCRDQSLLGGLHHDIPIADGRDRHHRPNQTFSRPFLAAGGRSIVGSIKKRLSRLTYVQDA